MSEQIEIEFKNLLTETEFEQILKAHQIGEKQFVKQKNYYFDTPEFELKDRACALRIRERGGRYEMTLKEPLLTGEGLLETNTELDYEKASSILSGSSISPIDIRDKISQMGIDPEQMSCFGTLTTARAEIPYEGGLLVFDKSTYFDVTDYELEYETNHYEEGMRIFEELLKKASIPQRKTDNKVRRFFTEMQRVKTRVD